MTFANLYPDWKTLRPLPYHLFERMFSMQWDFGSGIIYVRLLWPPLPYRHVCHTHIFVILKYELIQHYQLSTGYTVIAPNRKSMN